MIKLKSIKKAALCLSMAGVMFTSAITGTIPEKSGTVSAASVCTVNTGKTYQSITGFGGINLPEWTMDKGGDLTDAQRLTAFGNGDDQLGLTVLRVYINPDKTQWYKAVPTAKYAQKMGATIFATPWEPPKELTESGGSKGKLHLPKANYAAYAKHLNDFGEYMKSQGVDIYAISVQNEPDYASEWTYWSTDETTDFLANYADKITSAKVMSPESFQYSPAGASWINGGDGGKTYYTKILKNEKAFANCDLFGTHFYGTIRDWMDFPELESCGKPIWMTEVYVPDSSIDADKWPESLDQAENIHNALVVSNMSAYVVWYLRRSYGPIKEDGNISKRGYLISQYSKYIRPGAVRLDTTEQPAKDVYVSSYKNTDGTIVIVAVNKSSEGYAQEFSLGSIGIKNIDRYRTSETENLKLTKSLENADGKFFAQLPAQSVSTFVVTPDGVIPSDPTTPTPVKPNEYGWYFSHGFEADECGWESRGSANIAVSSDEHYTKYGSNSLYVSGRKSSWNGAAYALDSSTFIPGESYSFSAHVKYTDSSTEYAQFKLSLEYKGSDGETHYDKIAQSYAVADKWVQLANTSYQIPEGATNCKIYVETLDDSLVSYYMDEVIGAIDGTTIVGEGAMTEPPKEDPTDPPKEDPTDPPKEDPTDPPKEDPTDPPKEDPTDPPKVDPTDPPEEVQVIRGDLNFDKAINVFDLIVAKRYRLSGKYITDNDLFKAADVNQSGTFGQDDIDELTEYLLGIRKEFNVCTPPTV